MAGKPKVLVFDTWSIIAYYEDEPTGERVAQLIADANENSTPMWMSVVNAGEVWYIMARRTSQSEADATINELHNIGIQFDNAEWKISRQAGVFKSKHKMSFADAYAAALSLQKNAHLVTGDKEFLQLENDIKVLWLH